MMKRKPSSFPPLSAALSVPEDLRAHHLWPTCALCRGPVEGLVQEAGIRHIRFFAECHGALATAVLDVYAVVDAGSVEAAFAGLVWTAPTAQEASTYGR